MFSIFFFDSFLPTRIRTRQCIIKVTDPNLQAFLETRHPGDKYCVYNLCRGGRLQFSRAGAAQDAWAAWAPHRAPLLAPLYRQLQHMYQWLGRDERAASVIACQVGTTARTHSPIEHHRCRVVRDFWLSTYIWPNVAG